MKKVYCDYCEKEIEGESLEWNGKDFCNLDCHKKLLEEAEV